MCYLPWNVVDEKTITVCCKYSHHTGDLELKKFTFPILNMIKTEVFPIQSHSVCVGKVNNVSVRPPNSKRKCRSSNGNKWGRMNKFHIIYLVPLLSSLRIISFFCFGRKLFRLTSTCCLTLLHFFSMEKEPFAKHYNRRRRTFELHTEIICIKVNSTQWEISWLFSSLNFFFFVFFPNQVQLSWETRNERAAKSK